MNDAVEQQREPPSADPASRRRPPGYYRFGVILGALAAMGPLAIDMYLPSFPAIGRDLGVGASQVEVTVSTYFLGLMLGQLVYGPVSDRIGRKPPLYGGLALFLAASVGCALAGSMLELIGLRFVQALGGAASMMMTRAIVRDSFGDVDAARVLSLLMLVMGVAPILSPLLGGWMLLVVGWRAVFLVQAAFAILCLAAVAFALPESLPPERRQSRGVVRVLGTYARLLADRAFMANALAGGFVIAGMFAYIAGSPFVFIQVFGVSPDRYGYFFGANAIGIIGASQIVGLLGPRLDPGRVLRRILWTVAGAGLLLAVDGLTGFGGFPGILVPLFVSVASVGCVMPLSTVLAMTHQGERAGSASALMGTLQFGLGAAAGGLVSLLNDGTPAAMVVVVGGCGLGAVLVRNTRLLVR